MRVIFIFWWEHQAFFGVDLILRWCVRDWPLPGHLLSVMECGTLQNQSKFSTNEFAYLGTLKHRICRTCVLYDSNLMVFVTLYIIHFHSKDWVCKRPSEFSKEWRPRLGINCKFFYRSRCCGASREKSRKKTRKKSLSLSSSNIHTKYYLI